MPTRRHVLGLIPAAFLRWDATASAAGGEPGDFERIDAHTHIHRPAPALFASLEEGKWSGLDLVVCPTSGDEAIDLESRLRSTLEAARSSGGRLAWASTFDARGFEDPGFADRTIARLKQSFDDGAIGVKVWKNIGMAIRGKSGAFLLPDDPALLPIHEAIRRAGKTLIAHLAEPDGAWLPLDDRNPEFPYYSKNPRWHMFGRADAPSKAQILAARDRVLARYPDLRVVGCHLGSDEDDLGRLARRLDAYPNFAVDTAARIRYFARTDRDRARAFLDRYQDRILYATDYALGENSPEVGARGMKAMHDLDWRFFATADPLEYEGRPTRGLALTEPILRKVFRENARRWLPGVGV